MHRLEPVDLENRTTIDVLGNFQRGDPDLKTSVGVFHGGWLIGGGEPR